MWHSLLTIPPSDAPVRQMNILCRHCDPGRYALQLTINLCGHWFTWCEVSVDLCIFTQRTAVSHSGGKRSGSTSVIQGPSLIMSMLDNKLQPSVWLQFACLCACLWDWVSVYICIERVYLSMIVLVCSCGRILFQYYQGLATYSW